jgi:hypothetical protein
MGVNPKVLWDPVRLPRWWWVEIEGKVRKGELEAYVNLTAKALRVAEGHLVHHFQVESGE